MLYISYNFQIHQLGFTAESYGLEGHWSSLARRSEGIHVFHFSAVPKPVHLLLGGLTQKTAEHMFPELQRKQLDVYLTDDTKDLNARIDCLAKEIYEHHKARAARSSLHSRQSLHGTSFTTHHSWPQSFGSKPFTTRCGQII